MWQERFGSDHTVVGGTVVLEGVVADVRQTALTTPPEPTFYTSLAQAPKRAFTLVVRAATPAAALVPAVRGVVHGLDPEQPLGNIATMQQLLSRSVARPRFYAMLLGTFAALAVTLALLGLYAVMAQSVAQRRHEIGIRVALGARAADVLGLLLGQGMRLAAIGALLGLAGALAAGRLLTRLLFGIGPADMPTLLGVIALLLAGALLATSIPALRAARLDPARALRR